MKRFLLTSFIIALLISGCRVVNHPRPDLSMEPLPVMDPAQDEELAALCPILEPPNDLWGGLDPAYPMAACRGFWDREKDPAEAPALYVSGCAFPQMFSLVIFKDGAYQKLDQLWKIQQTFAPIDSPEEALSYALVATDLYPLYGQQVSPSLEYFQNRLEDTHVEQTDDGWLVNLFDYRWCGCGEHYEYTVDVLVTREGEVTVGTPVQLDLDPEDFSCAD